MHAIARWWDGIELWITGLPFIPQSIVVLLVLVHAAFGISCLFDRILAEVLRLLGRDARSESGLIVAPNDSSTTEGH